MAIIKVTQKTFTKVAMEQLDSMDGLFASAFLGGKDRLKEELSNTPDECVLWVNTDHVAAISGPIKAAETGEVVFRIYFKQVDKDDKPLWVKIEDYKKFILAWGGYEKPLEEGKYTIPEGHIAKITEDGAKIVIEKT